MTSTGTYLAIFLGSKHNPRMAEWMALPETERKAKEQKGIAAWKTWMEQHEAAVIGRVARSAAPSACLAGALRTSSTRWVRSPSCARNRMRLRPGCSNHPHFTIFPGEALEVIPILPIPGG